MKFMLYFATLVAVIVPNEGVPKDQRQTKPSINPITNGSLKKCPAAIPMKNFDMKKYGGAWITTYYNNGRSLNCGIAVHEHPSSNILRVKYYAPTAYIQSPTTATPFAVHDLSVNGAVFTGNLKKPTKRESDAILRTSGSIKFTFTVVDTDYTNYFLVIGCQEDGQKISGAATIYTRNGKLDKVLLEKAKTQMSSYGFKPQDIKKFPNCNYDPNPAS